MKKLCLFAALLYVLLLTGCASKTILPTTTPVAGPIQLTYPQSSGRIKTTVSIGDYRFAFDLSQYEIEYSVVTSDNHLLWELEIESKLRLSIIDPKKDRGTKVPFLAPLKKHHNKITCFIKTDHLGNFLSVEKVLDALTKEAITDKYWMKYYAQVFQMLVVPFAHQTARQGDIISVGKVMIPIKHRDHFPTPKVVLSGEVRWKGKQCLALTHKAKSALYKTARREKRIDTLSAEIIIDKETKMLKKAKTVYRTGQAFIFIDAKNMTP